MDNVIISSPPPESNPQPQGVTQNPVQHSSDRDEALAKIYGELDAHLEQIKKVKDDIGELVSTTKSQQGVIRDLFDRVRHSETIVFFGFIILLFMMGTIIIDVGTNIWGKLDSSPQPAINIYGK